MAQITLTYEVPVWVVVDTDAGTVERVVVGDENARLDRDDINGPGAPVDEDDAPITDKALADRARAIAEGEAEWPAWEFGW